MQPDQRAVQPFDAIRASPGLTIAAVGAAVVALSTVLPWLSGAGDSANAFEQDLPWMATGATIDDPGSFAHGLIYLALAVAAAAVIWRSATQPDLPLTPVMGVGGAILALSVLNFVQFNSVLGDIDDGGGFSLSIGVGLYVSLAGGAAILVGSLMHQQQPAGAVHSTMQQVAAPNAGFPPQAAGSPGAPSQAAPGSNPQPLPNQTPPAQQAQPGFPASPSPQAPPPQQSAQEDDQWWN